jgi:hypothetical protein
MTSQGFGLHKTLRQPVQETPPNVAQAGSQLSARTPWFDCTGVTARHVKDRCGTLRECPRAALLRCPSEIWPGG